MDYIQEHPGLTAGEIEDGSGIRGAWKRCSDLKRMNLVYVGPDRIYAGTGKDQETLFPVKPRQGVLFP